MPHGSYIEDDNVLCPFYVRENVLNVKCEGLCGQHTVSTFDSKKSKAEYKEDFCQGFYWNCLLYRALEQEYNEEVP